MNFKPELCELVLKGSKTVTRRPVADRTECQYKEGRDYAICPGRGKSQLGRMVVHSVRQERLGWIDDEEAVLEGFADREAFIAYWMKLYGRWQWETLVWRIEFTVVHLAVEEVFGG